MKFSISLIIALLSFAFVSSAAAAVTYGGGASSCSTWTERRADDDHYTMTQWGLGYISAASAYERELNESEINGILSYMDEYCEANPRVLFSAAVRSLVADLKNKQKPDKQMLYVSL